ncbi:hypothetical protein [Rhodococcus maanshanensis]|uniref:Uncharacterized protein n=1 Tax=Rhodococcus maanshanensis TaxID=183556 RepID=A0A1H7MKZ2_9NOCA|nr:hypothetical protein [Rhodococcus maanshanensis]SEL11872.1 hypothetical protein SAMN05444583_10658 [Rhodococcus maanshanensis]
MTEPVSTASVQGLRVGDLVEVRSAEEIMATLDERGELENLPFMPEMLGFCGRRLTVRKVAHKLCDPVNKTGMHKMANAVHLTGSRCDGSAHGGCQTACSLYWKEAWLKRVEPGMASSATGGPIDLPLLEINTRKEPGQDGAPRYSCQATEILRAAPTCLPFRDVRQYVTDVRTGNVTALESLLAFLVAFFNRLQHVSKRVLPPKLWFRDGLPWGFVKGRVIGRTPTGHLDLQPGEMVRIKTKEQIEATLNKDRLNRGMGFEEEMARFCGRTARVQARVTKCMDERTGELLTMKSPCIVLEDIVCAGVYNASCPREYVSFWREIWLERA